MDFFPSKKDNMDFSFAQNKLYIYIKGSMDFEISHIFHFFFNFFFMKNDMSITILQYF